MRWPLESNPIIACFSQSHILLRTGYIWQKWSILRGLHARRNRPSKNWYVLQCVFCLVINDYGGRANWSYKKFLGSRLRHYSGCRSFRRQRPGVHMNVCAKWSRTHMFPTDFGVWDLWLGHWWKEAYQAGEARLSRNLRHKVTCPNFVWSLKAFIM